MLCEFKISTEAVGLGIHPDKTKILSNQDKVKAKEIEVDNIKIEILGKTASARYLGRKITFEDQETEEIKNRLKAAWAAFHKYRQELTSKDYRLCHRLRLFNMVVTPTMTYASSTWTLTQKHEKMIKTAQRNMLPLIVQTKRRYKPKKVKMNKKEEGTEKVEEKDEGGTTDKETDEGSEQDSKTDQDSDVSFQEDADEEIDATENEEDWIEYIKRSTKEADEHMEKHNVKCWIEVHRRQKWRMARRIITLPEKRWNRRVFNWHPGLDSNTRARRQVGRPKRRWEDDLNEFMKTEEGQDGERNDLKNNNSWMKGIEDYKKWKENQEKFSKI